MNKLILRFLNTPLVFLISLLGIGLQTSLFNSYPFLYLQPDIILLLVIWFSLKRNFTEGGALTLLVSYAVELHSSAPKGLMMVAYMTVFLSIRGMNHLFLFTRPATMVGLSLFVSVVFHFLILIILALMGNAANHWRHTVALVLPHAVIEGVASIWIFRWMERFDWLTYKDERARKAIEDELQLEEEGL